MFFPKVFLFISGMHVYLKERKEQPAYLTILSYSPSFPFESLHFLNITEASTFAGENVFGSFNNEITLKRMVL